MEADLANLSIDDEEEGNLVLCEGNPSNEEDDRRYCLVGRALTDCVRGLLLSILEIKDTYSNSFIRLILKGF